MDGQLDAQVAALASQQYGVVTRTQAKALGASESFLKHRCRTGRWEALSREAFVIAGVPRSFERDLLAGTFSLPGGCAGFEAASQVWEMVGPPTGRVVVLVEGRGNHRLAFARVRETNSLPDRHVTSVRGIPVTTRERTICDCARL